MLYLHQQLSRIQPLLFNAHTNKKKLFNEKFVLNLFDHVMREIIHQVAIAFRLCNFEFTYIKRKHRNSNTNVLRSSTYVLNMDLQEEIEALRAILMNDVTVDPSGGETRVDMKLEGYMITIKLQGEMFIILKGHFA